MILELDLGNSSAKWRLLDVNAHLVEHGVSGIDTLLQEDFPSAWERVERVRIASVLSSATEDALIAKIHSHLKLLPEMAKSTAICGGVTNSYAEPERLGVDRWLAMIAAYQKKRAAVVVVDIGTALKVDAINDSGQHLGGYIIPGVGLMERALLEGTDRVRYDSGNFLQAITLGQDTRSCVECGVTAALVGAALIGVERCRVAIGRQPIVLITGGMGMLLKQRLDDAGVDKVYFEPDLVLDGLRFALP